MDIEVRLITLVEAAALAYLEMAATAEMLLLVRLALIMALPVGQRELEQPAHQFKVEEVAAERVVLALVQVALEALRRSAQVVVVVAEEKVQRQLTEMVELAARLVTLLVGLLAQQDQQLMARLARLALVVNPVPAVEEELETEQPQASEGRVALPEAAVAVAVLG